MSSVNIAFLTGSMRLDSRWKKKQRLLRMNNGASKKRRGSSRIYPKLLLAQSSVRVIKVEKASGLGTRNSGLKNMGTFALTSQELELLCQATRMAGDRLARQENLA